VHVLLCARLIVIWKFPVQLYAKFCNVSINCIYEATNQRIVKRADVTINASPKHWYVTCNVLPNVRAFQITSAVDAPVGRTWSTCHYSLRCMTKKPHKTLHVPHTAEVDGVCTLPHSHCMHADSGSWNKPCHLLSCNYVSTLDIMLHAEPFNTTGETFPWT
jgi:hypothetical protein